MTRNMTTAAIATKILQYAGILYLRPETMSGAAWNVLAIYADELTDRCGDEQAGRYEARRALADAKELLALKPADFGGLRFD